MWYGNKKKKNREWGAEKGGNTAECLKGLFWPYWLPESANPADVASSPRWAPTARRQRLVSAEPRWSPGTACTAGRKAGGVNKGVPAMGVLLAHPWDSQGSIHEGFRHFSQGESKWSLPLATQPPDPYRQLAAAHWGRSLWSRTWEKRESGGVKERVMAESSTGSQRHRAQTHPWLHWFCCLQSISGTRSCQLGRGGVKCLCLQC